MPCSGIPSSLEGNRIKYVFVIECATNIPQNIICRNILLLSLHKRQCTTGRCSLGVRSCRIAGISRGRPWRRLCRSILTAHLPTPPSAPEPAGEAVPQTEPAWRQSLLISRTNSAVILDVGGVHVRGQRCDERMKHISRECYKWRKTRVCVRKRYIKSQDSSSIWACSLSSAAASSQSLRTPRLTIPHKDNARP